MTTEGWVFMIVSWGVIIGLNIYTYTRILSTKSPSKKD